MRSHRARHLSACDSAGDVPKEEVAEHLILGLLDALPDAPMSEGKEIGPEIEFAYDEDVFRRVWALLSEAVSAAG